jgi:ADP-ribose pyrophosphatase YjhB (NUDIX family)
MRCGCEDVIEAAAGEAAARGRTRLRPLAQVCRRRRAGEPGESLVEAVGREVLEETASSFTAERLVGVYLARVDGASRGSDERDVTYLRFAFAGSVGAQDPTRPLDSGIVRTLWLTLDELRACRDRHRSVLVLRSIEDAAAGCALPLERLVTDASVRRT